VRNTGPPQFSSKIQNTVTIIGVVNLFELPSITDPDSDDKVLSKDINFGEAKSFISGSWPKFMILPQDNETHPGNYEIVVTLQDDNPNRLQSVTTFNLTVLPLPPSKFSIMGSQNITNSTNKTKKTQAELLNNQKGLQGKIRKISSDGVVTVSFNRAIVVP